MSDTTAKITITGEDQVSGMFVRVGESIKATGQAAGVTGTAAKDMGQQFSDASSKVTSFSKYIEGLRPSTDTANAGFLSLKGTITEMWENPTHAAQGLAGALGTDLASGLGAAGIAAGLAAGAIAGVGYALYEAGEHAATVGGLINDMSEKMALSAESTSTLKYAMDIAGGSIEQASNLIFQLQRRMADSPDEVEKGLNRIGLSIQQLESLEPDQQLYAISKAFQENTNQSNRAATAMEIFSRSGRDAIPLLMKDLSGLSDEAHRLGYEWSEVDAKAAEDFEMKSRALHERWNQMTIALGRDLIPAMTGLIGVAERTGEAFAHIADLGGLVSGGYRMVTDALGNHALAAETSAAKQDVINKALSLGAPEGIAFGDAVKYVDEAFGRVAPATDTAAALVEAWYRTLDTAREKAAQTEAASKSLTDGLAEHGVVMGAVAGEVETANRKWEEAVRKRAEEEKRAAAEAEKEAAFWREYNSVGASVYDTLMKIDGATVVGIADDLRRGVSVEQAAHAWGVYKEQVKAVAEQEKFLASVQNETKASLGGMLITIPDLSGRTEEFREHLEELFSTVNQFTGGLSVAGDQLDHVVIPAFSTLPNVTAGATDAIKQATTHIDHAKESVIGLATSFGQLGQQVGGMAGQIITAAGGIAQAFEKMQLGKMTGSQFAGQAIGMGAGIAAGMIDTSGQSGSGSVVGSGALQGAGTGAMIGSVIPGLGTGVGAAVGAGVGAIAGLIQSGKEWRQVINDIGRDFAGIKVSDDFAKMIEKLESDTGLGSAQAITTQLDQLIKMSGGLDSKNIDLFTQKLHDAFSYIEQKSMSVAQVTQVLDKNFAAFAAAGTDSMGRLGENIREIIKLNDAFGTHSQAVTAYIQQQTTTAATGFNAEAAAIGNDATALSSLGFQAVGTYASMVAAGKTQAEALAAIGPGLDTLTASYKTLGLDVDDVGLSALMMQRTITQANPALVAGIDGLSSSMVALDNIGLMNATTFGAMERTGVQMYTRLQAQVAAVGGTTVDALGPMQAYLHQAETEAKALGIPLDDNTAELIRQSQELGVWRDTGKSASDVLTEGMTSLVEKVAELIDKLNGVTTATNAIPRHVDVDVQGHYTAPDAPSGGDDGTQAFARGGVVYAANGWGAPQGTDTVKAWLTPGERVLSVPDTQRFERQGGLTALRGGADPVFQQSVRDLHTEVKGLRADNLRIMGTLPLVIRHALRGA